MKNRSLFNNNLREKIFAALILIFLLVIYFNSVVFQGNSFMTTIERSYQLGHYHYEGTYWHEARKLVTLDPTAANQINLPASYLESHYLKTFQLPLWNPYSGLGRPYNADMNSYTFFLPIYLFKLFPSLTMYDLFLLLRLFIAGFFLFLFLRLYKCQFWVAIAGASFYMFNSHFYAFIDMDHINVTIFLPAMLYFLTKFLTIRDKRYLIGFIFCSAGSFYGGNPNEFILIHVFITAYFLFLVFLRDPFTFKKKFEPLYSYVVAVGFSLLLTSVKLIPFIEFWKNSVSSRTGSLGMTDFLSIKKFLTLTLFPDQMYGGPNYIGYIILSLMCYSLFNLIRSKWQLREKIVAFHFILLVLMVSKLTNAAYIKWIGTLPVFNNINYVKYCSLIYYTVSFLSAISLVYLAEDIKKTKKKIIRLFIFLLCCILPHLALRSISKELLFQAAENGSALLYMSVIFILLCFFLITVKKTYRNKVVTNGCVVALMILAVFELRLNNHQHYRKRFRINDHAPYSQFLLKQKLPYRAFGMQGTLMPNHNLVYPIPTVNRMFAMRVKRSVYLLSRLISPKFNSGMTELFFEDEILNNPYLDFLNMKYCVSESIINSIVINPDYANSHNVKTLLDNPLMQYTHCGDSYYYGHWGWKQMSNSSVHIPVLFPHGDIYLKATALAFNFDWYKRKNPENRLHLEISVEQGNQKETVFERTFAPHEKEVKDFFTLEVSLNKYAGREAVIHFTLHNPGAKNRNDRSFFYGDLRITYNKIKGLPSGSYNEEKLSGFSSPEKIPYEEVFSHHAIVYQNNKALERGFVLYNIKRVKDYNEAIAVMEKEPALLRKTALIEGDYPDNIETGKEGRSKIAFLEYKANSIKMEAETTENGVFILSDAYYPGWKAYLNKKQVKIYPAFGALRGVFLSKGKHELVFCYRPRTFYLGAVLTFITLVFLGYVFFTLPKILKR